MGFEGRPLRSRFQASTPSLVSSMHPAWPHSRCPSILRHHHLSSPYLFPLQESAHEALPSIPFLFSCGSSYRSSLWRSSTMFFVSTTSSFTSSILDANSPDQYSSSSRSGLSSSASWISFICPRASWICCTNSSIGWGLWVDIYTSLSCVPLGVQVLASFTKRV